MQEETREGKPAWLIVHTKPRQELRALQHLQNQSYTCYLPTIKAIKAVHGKVTTCSEPLFSRYIFIRVNPSACSAIKLSSTRGVSRLVAFGERFATVPDEMIESLQKTEPVMRTPFTWGEQVGIKEGPLAGLEGIYQLTNGEERAIVLINMLGRQQNLSIKLSQLQRLN